MPELNNLTDLLVHEIQDLHSAESQLVEALPKMAAAATSGDLKDAFDHHLQETKQHVVRLNEAASLLNVTPQGETCEAMKGLIREGSEMVEKRAAPAVKDAALIASAQRIEHYEIAAYGAASCFANCTDEKAVLELLVNTLDEEKEADSKLNKLAKGSIFSSGINEGAVAHR